jgi:TPR repeat protein
MRIKGTADSLREAKNHYDNKEYKKALECYKKLANHGVSEAQLMLGHMYENGEGMLFPNKKKAAEWRKEAGGI